MLATLEWVDWYNTERLHSACKYIPPKEYEENYYAQQLVPPPASFALQSSCGGGAIKTVPWAPPRSGLALSATRSQLGHDRRSGRKPRPKLPG